ncbi:MAG TPA: flagellar hook protein FlgE [Burkholderiaceae bacterium]|jgi:flagellar hook protein FlgE|nr:flagellar hook protein FlgE [Burkholderiaceae bacterium]
MSFQHGLAGLSAAAANLDVIGNNVANAGTVGAKSSRAEFADMYANSLTGATSGGVGIGVTVSAVAQQFTQGDIVSTKNPLDMAINGRGFFRLSQGGATMYSRNGQFRMDKDGYIVNAQGARLTGYAADAEGRINAGMPSELRIVNADAAPRATAEASAQLNLDARATAITGAFNATDPRTYHSAMSMTVYDSLGRDHLMTLYYRKSGDNAWEIRSAIDGNMVPGAPATLSFTASGAVDTTVSPQPFTLSVPVGADAGGNQSIAIDLSQATQFGAAFGTAEVKQDGYANGRLTGFSIDEAGVLVGRYSNGQTRAQGQIALANFVNPQGLNPTGNNAWLDTASSGPPTLGTPNSGSLGTLVAGAVENSNVDLTGELVSMISAQRTYQANAQTIKTHDQMLQTIVNLR